MKKVVCIVGPTASGKTALSLKVAQHFHTDLINADAVQIYKKLDIGSAKIKADEMQGVKHHLLSVADYNDNYTIYQFQNDARSLIKWLDLPVFVGGSGLYLKSALYDYKLDVFSETEEVAYFEGMYEKLMEIDPTLIIDRHNKRRIISAYRQAIKGSLRSHKDGKNQPLYQICMIYLDIDRKVLENRLEKRLEMMIQEGFLDEVKKLIAAGYHDFNVIGYREIESYLNKKMSLNDAKTCIIRKSMQFAKRQKTWFLNQMEVQVFDALDEHLDTAVMEYIERFLDN